MHLGFLLSALAFFITLPLLTVGIGYLAVRGHWHEIPLSRSGAVAMSAFVSMAFAAGWLTLGTVGYAIGQVVGNGNVGSLLGGGLGVVGWVTTTIVYGSRMTRGLAELYVTTFPSARATFPGNVRSCLLVGLAAIFLATVGLIVGAALVGLFPGRP